MSAGEDTERNWVWMNIQRPRWILRRADGKILVGQQRNYEFRDVADIKDARIATYMSEKKALNAAESQGWLYYGYDIHAERVIERYDSF